MAVYICSSIVYFHSVLRRLRNSDHSDLRIPHSLDHPNHSIGRARYNY